MQQIRLKCPAWMNVTMGYFEVHEVFLFCFSCCCPPQVYKYAYKVPAEKHAQTGPLVNEVQLLIIPSEHWEAHYIAECYLKAPGQPLKDNIFFFTVVCVTQHNCSKIYYHYYIT